MTSRLGKVATATISAAFITAMALAVQSTSSAAQATTPPATAQPKTPPQNPPATGQNPPATPAAGAKAATPAAPKAPPASGIAPLVNKPGQAWDERNMTVPFVGRTDVYVPKQPTTHVVLFISGDGGWNLGVVDMSRRFAARAIVVGIGYPTLRKAQNALTRCWLPGGDLEEIAHSVEKQLALPTYYAPILVGYSSGATLVYGALAGSPPTTFAGGMSLGFCPDLPTNVRVCDNGDWKPTFEAKKSTAMLPQTPAIPHEWFVLHGVQDQVCSPPDTQKFLDGMGGVHFITIEGTGHGFSHENHWGQPFDDSIAKLLAADAPPAKTKPVTASMAAIQSQLDTLNLPLDYVWANNPRAAIVFVSGDGGWAEIDQAVAAYAAAHGVSVVGLSTIKYFWSKKTPEQAGADTARIAKVLSNANFPIFFGGFSFGAEVAPFALGSWPEADRRGVRGQILIAPGETASFEVNPLDWVRRAKETPFVVAQQVKTLKVPTICVTGDKEAPSDTACDDLGTAGEMVKLPGSHHFNGKFDDVGKAVMAFIDKTLGPSAKAVQLPADLVVMTSNTQLPSPPSSTMNTKLVAALSGVLVLGFVGWHLNRRRRVS